MRLQVESREEERKDRGQQGSGGQGRTLRGAKEGSRLSSYQLPRRSRKQGPAGLGREDAGLWRPLALLPPQLWPLLLRVNLCRVAMPAGRAEAAGTSKA